MIALLLDWLDTARAGAAAALMLAGAAAAFIAALGVARLPDFYSRLHAAGIADTLAFALFYSGIILHQGWSLAALKLALMMPFFFITAPTATYAAANAALGAGLAPVVGPWRGSRS